MKELGTGEKLRKGPGGEVHGTNGTWNEEAGLHALEL